MSTRGSRVIKPIRFDSTQLVSTTAMNDATWVAGSYALGAKVTKDVANAVGVVLPHQFESLIAANTDVPGESANWLNQGYANTVALFDATNMARKTSAATELVMEIAPASYATAIGLFGLEGDHILLEVLGFDGVTVVDTRELTLFTRVVTTMLEYLWTMPTRIERAVFEDLPVFPGRKIRITLTGGIAAIGGCVYGSVVELGLPPRYGANWELTDFLGVKRDEFGTMEELKSEAPYADTISVSIEVEKARIPSVKAALVKLRQTPTVWVCDGGDDSYTNILTVLGVFDQVSLVVAYDTFSVLDVRVIGMSAV